MNPPNEVAEAAKYVPSIAVSAYSFLGLPAQQWVYVLTAVYTLFQVIRLLPKMYSCVLCFSKNWKCRGVCKQG